MKQFGKKEMEMSNEQPKELSQKNQDELAYQQAMQEFLANGGVIQQIPRNK